VSNATWGASGRVARLRASFSWSAPARPQWSLDGINSRSRLFKPAAFSLGSLTAAGGPQLLTRKNGSDNRSRLFHRVIAIAGLLSVEAPCRNHTA
jgi:hypothetical protein